MSNVQWEREDVTIVMAGSPPAPEGPLQATANAVARSTSGRLDAAGDHAAPPSSSGQPAFPPLTIQAANLFQASVAFVGDGCAVVDDAEYRQRLETCRTCERRVGKRCTACGCWINVKARGRAFACPLGRWQ